MSTSRGDGKEVAQILNQGKYDLQMFLAYLKTFAVSGEQPDKSILLGILMQSLARFNASDFNACMCLVSPHVQESPTVTKELELIYELENFLSSGQFSRFWEQWNRVKEHLPESFNFETRIRTTIIETIAFTMEKISFADLSIYLSASPAEIPKIVENAQRESGEFEVVACNPEEKNVVFSRNIFNYPQSTLHQDLLKFSDVVQILQ